MIKIILVKKEIGEKICWSKKNLGKKKLLVKKKIGHKIVWSKKNLGLEKFLVEKSDGKKKRFFFYYYTLRLHPFLLSKLNLAQLRQACF